MFQNELDIMNADVQSTFAVPLVLRRQTKGTIDPNTGAATVSATINLPIVAVRLDTIKASFSPGGGRSQNIDEVVYEINKDQVPDPTLSPGDPQLFPPPRKGDLIIDGSRSLSVEHVREMIDRKVWVVSTRQSEKAVP